MNLDALKELHHKRGREAQHRYLLEGEHLVLELQRAAEHDPRLRTAEIYITHERGVWPSVLSTHVINARHMAQLSETRSAQGIVAVVPILPPAAPRAEELGTPAVLSRPWSPLSVCSAAGEAHRCAAGAQASGAQLPCETSARSAPERSFGAQPRPGVRKALSKAD